MINQVKFSVKTVVSLVSLSLAAVLTGCASSNVKITDRAPYDSIVKPDFVLVQNLAISPGKVKLDDGMIAKAIRDKEKVTQTQQEIKLGKLAAKTFTDSLIKYLKMAGVKAVKAGAGQKPTGRTLVLGGKFIQVNRGNQAVRVLIGFGFGNGDIKALIICSQNGAQIARAVVSTTGGHKPGILVPVAGGAAAGSIIVSSTVSGASAVVGEGFLASLQADVDRAAKGVAKKIVQGYINHNWLPKDAIDKLNGLF